MLTRCGNRQTPVAPEEEAAGASTNEQSDEEIEVDNIPVEEKLDADNAQILVDAMDDITVNKVSIRESAKKHKIVRLRLTKLVCLSHGVAS